MSVLILPEVKAIIIMNIVIIISAISCYISFIFWYPFISSFIVQNHKMLYWTNQFQLDWSARQHKQSTENGICKVTLSIKVNRIMTGKLVNKVLVKQVILKAPLRNLHGQKSSLTTTKLNHLSKQPTLDLHNNFSTSLSFNRDNIKQGIKEMFWLRSLKC